MCYRMSNLMICRFTSNNFNYSLLVAPSFANDGNLFVFPIYYEELCNTKMRATNCFNKIYGLLMHGAEMDRILIIFHN